MKLILTRILTFVIIILMISLAGCKEQEKDPVSSKPIGNFNVAEADDSKDPQNTEDTIDDGQKIDANKLSQKKGKANGIDVSKWQGKIDWKKVKASGIDFAIIRVGYRGENGLLYKDSNADYNIQQAQKAGVLVGVYFFSTAIDTKEAKEEAEWTVSLIKGYKISYPVVYDCEGFDNADSRMYNLTAKARTDNAFAFLNTVKGAGYEPMFYASKSDLEQGTAFETERLEDNFMIWLARYTAPPYPETEKPDYFGRYDMWQYTNKGVVNGIEGYTDMVVSYFERKSAKPKDSNADIPEVTPPKDAQELIYKEVNETVTAKIEVNLRSGAGTNFESVGKLTNGSTLKRTGIGTNGWSRLIYKGKTVYAITSYLTTDLAKPPEPKEDIVEGNVFTAKKDKVTAKEEVNLRSLPTTSGQIVGKLLNGEVLERTAVSNRGWSRLTFNGKTVYAVTSYLTDDLSYKPEVDDGIRTEFTAVNEQVTAKNETNLRTLPSVETGGVVYTLKNGEYVKRTGVATNGWSRLEYNGKTVYAVSSYLTK